MSFSSKADLRAAIKNWLELTTEVADTIIDDWIALAEADLNRRLRLVRRQETADLAILTNTDTVAAPSDFREPVDLHLDTSPRTRVRLATVETVRGMQLARTSGPPRFFAVRGDSANDVSFLFGPVPDTGYTGKLNYWAAFSLATSTGAEEILQRWPDAYLYGSLFHAEGYLGNDPRMPAIEEEYLEAVQGIIDETNRSQFGAGAAGAPA